VREGAAAGLVTAPIHKEALAAAGIGFPGHTEMLQALAGEGGALSPVRMMLANDELRTVLVSIHVSLRDAIAAMTFANVRETLRIVDRAYIIHKGKVMTEGSGDFLINDPQARELYLGQDFNL